MVVRVHSGPCGRFQIPRLLSDTIRQNRPYRRTRRRYQRPSCGSPFSCRSFVLSQMDLGMGRLRTVTVRAWRIAHLMACACPPANKPVDQSSVVKLKVPETGGFSSTRREGRRPPAHGAPLGSHGWPVVRDGMGKGGQYNRAGPTWPFWRPGVRASE